MHQDLGSNPRSPQFAFVIFLQVITCRSKRIAHHTPSLNQAPDGSRPDLVIQDDGPPWDQINQCAWNPRSQPGLRQLGHKIADQTPFPGPNLLTLSIFFIISFNYLLLLFYY